MGVYNAVDGTVFDVSNSFLDDDDEAIVPKQGYPKVRLLDKEKAQIVSVLAVPDSIPGKWKANLAIPDLGLTDKQEFVVNWICVAVDGTKYRDNETVIIEPRQEVRTGDIVILNSEQNFDLSLPVVYTKNVDYGSCKIFYNNVQHPNILDLDDMGIVTQVDKTRLSIQLTSLDPQLNASLEPYLLRIATDISGTSRSFNYKLYVITPQIALAMSDLEDFLNKSKIENVIPALTYTDSDLVYYLQRGLALFNSIAMVTAFTGTNMQGVLYDGWILCSSYYALGAQLLAEGSLAFDFSGQGVSLNVDRTPQLDSALGRIESAIDNRVVALKKQIVKQGYISGDGSAGSTAMRNPHSLGTLGLINAPTTRIRSQSHIFFGKRW